MASLPVLPSLTPKRGNHVRSASEPESPKTDPDDAVPDVFLTGKAMSLLEEAVRAHVEKAEQNHAAYVKQLEEKAARLEAALTLPTPPLTPQKQESTATTDASSDAVITGELAEKIHALGPDVVVHSMPNMKATHINLRTAQRMFPPEFCIFVGNLPAHHSDGYLTRAVKYEFGKFGWCIVGVFRKTPTKPYAIIQYSTWDDARAAFVEGQGLWMERPVRVEWSARASY
ncbi:hypothetical protein LTR37_017778 [Vermiconidia calcicola]|uniref:Uncharacterized protein n=1 Tax=Vermiconidia calcicola TaxID=1690605 RepID=A0ACC3MJ06_9PEZI|nr:hypothetical protein LTR37_017778 [Vermiconidia calcicola]